MSNAWETAQSLAEQHANSGGIFIRLSNNGDKVVGAFCGEPHAREVHWTGEKYVECTGDGCKLCAPGKRPSLRVMLNFYVPAESEMKVIEGGTAWFKDVIKVRDKYGLDKWLFEIERHGDSGDPKTTYSILPEEKTDDELRADIAAAALHDLANIGNGEEEEKAPAKSRAGSINPRVAGELVAQLKALPRSDVDTFLAEFKVERVRDLQASDEAKARKYIASLTAPQDDSEIDPFA
ncbi:MAG: hypothetical protein JXX14_14435 [Deltaproteobacteria bacterium]|nr:hypothetical protein [Deltaproteobacteria bacterium]